MLRAVLSINDMCVNCLLFEDPRTLRVVIGPASSIDAHSLSEDGNVTLNIAMLCNLCNKEIER
jgi:hypothetical protein